MTQFFHTLPYFYRLYFPGYAKNMPSDFVEYSTSPIEISDLLTKIFECNVWKSTLSEQFLSFSTKCSLIYEVTLENFLKITKIPLKFTKVLVSITTSKKDNMVCRLGWLRKVVKKNTKTKFFTKIPERRMFLSGVLSKMVHTHIVLFSWKVTSSSRNCVGVLLKIENNEEKN